MARVFLVNPPSPEPVRSPLLAFCHLGASLRAKGHEVALLDASAPFAPHAHAEIAERVAAFAPDLIGLHLKTQHVQPSYALARDLVARFPSVPLVAGGPHATVVPHEPITAAGFRYVIRGEGEEPLCELCDALSDTVIGRREVGGIAGLTYASPLGPRDNPTRPFVADLDALAPPLSAVDLFDPAWYGATGALPPTGLMSSRGCPAACSFCSNNVTGRRFRYRSAGAVADEVRDLKTRFGIPAFTFFDDSFAVGRRRVGELSDALAAVGNVHWTCTAHPAHLDRAVIADMRRGGCVGIDIGMESADAGMLLRIGKGVTSERVLDVLRWCNEVGVHVVVNLMFGWPDETDEELGATIDFMDRAASLADGFNARGVVVPYPGTPIYDDNHEKFGFTGWWLHEPPLDYPAFPMAWSPSEVRRAYLTDPALDRNFFHHPPHRLRRIREALAKKADYTLGRIAAKQRGPVAVPAAGSR